MSRYRDRKLGRTCTFVGYDVYADATTRGQVRTAFEPGSSIVSNWDVMEGVLDYIFVKLGVDGQSGGIDRPVVMTEPVANLGYSRKSTSPPYELCKWKKGAGADSIQR
jgi:actin-related protein 5